MVMVMMMPSSSSPGIVTSTVLVVFIVLSCFTSLAFADTSTFNNIGHNRYFLQFLDDFWFTKAHQGHIQLNVSNISFSNPNPAASFNLSQIAFFLIPRNYSTHPHFDTADCALNQSLMPPPKILYTFDNLVQPNKTKTSFHLLVTDLDKYNDDVYYLYFQNCNSPNENLTLSMNVQTSMYNFDPNTGRKSYLSSTKSLFPRIYLFCFLVYFSLVCLWVCLLYKNTKKNVCRIHVSMLMVVIFKALSTLLELLNVFYLSITGCAQCSTYFVLTYMSDFLSETPLIIVVILIFIGWSYMRPSLTYYEMTMLMLLVCFRASIIYVKTICLLVKGMDPFFGTVLSGFFIWINSELVVVFLYIAISSVVTYLHDAREAHGKASLIFKRIKQFRLLFIVFVLYSVYNIAVSRLQINYKPTQYLWSFVALKEIGTVILYMFIGYLFRPAGLMLNMPITDDDEKVAYESLNTKPDRYLRYMTGLSFRLPEP